MQFAEQVGGPDPMNSWIFKGDVRIARNDRRRPTALVERAANTCEWEPANPNRGRPLA
ncbi:hypothetical protein [Actinophytocola sp.]|uniref:hypothetical protein n=1 Tax=Actinophytocola sp. TaxID=1872138 RepID=UPI0025C0497F|nr:hypothetical protein [Actinophytocola sp.]